MGIRGLLQGLRYFYFLFRNVAYMGYDVICSVEEMDYTSSNQYVMGPISSISYNNLKKHLTN
jgi:hypothetical protein